MDTGLQKIVLDFFNTGTLTRRDQVFYCRTRDEALARLPRWLKDFRKLGVDQNSAAILTAILGELSNNSFDHNLGQWHDIPGCLVAYHLNKAELKIYIVDRGQGIISSLQKAGLVHLAPSTILVKAFTEHISGRAPEKRGNGLKFVSKHIVAAKASLFCFSNGEVFAINSPTVLQIPKTTNINGTYFEIHWRIS